MEDRCKHSLSNANVNQFDLFLRKLNILLYNELINYDFYVIWQLRSSFVKFTFLSNGLLHVMFFREFS